MKPLYVVATLVALASAATAQQPAGSRPRITIPSQSNSSGTTNMLPACRNHCFSWERGSGFHGGFGNVWIVEREVPVVIEKVVQAPPPVAPPPAPSPKVEGRPPYVVGASYASLPGSCMKMIEDGVSYYYCSGDWYREVRAGKEYRAVARRL